MAEQDKNQTLFWTRTASHNQPIERGQGDACTGDQVVKDVVDYLVSQEFTLAASGYFPDTLRDLRTGDPNLRADYERELGYLNRSGISRWEPREGRPKNTPLLYLFNVVGDAPWIGLWAQAEREGLIEATRLRKSGHTAQVGITRQGDVSAPWRVVLRKQGRNSIEVLHGTASDLLRDLKRRSLTSCFVQQITEKLWEGASYQPVSAPYDDSGRTSIVALWKERSEHTLSDLVHEAKAENDQAFQADHRDAQFHVELRDMLHLQGGSIPVGSWVTISGAPVLPHAADLHVQTLSDKGALRWAFRALSAFSPAALAKVAFQYPGAGHVVSSLNKVLGRTWLVSLRLRGSEESLEKLWLEVLDEVWQERAFKSNPHRLLVGTSDWSTLLDAQRGVLVALLGQLHGSVPMSLEAAASMGEPAAIVELYVAAEARGVVPRVFDRVTGQQLTCEELWPDPRYKEEFDKLKKKVAEELRYLQELHQNGKISDAAMVARTVVANLPTLTPTPPKEEPMPDPTPTLEEIKKTKADATQRAIQETLTSKLNIGAIRKLVGQNPWVTSIGNFAIGFSKVDSRLNLVISEGLASDGVGEVLRATFQTNEGEWLWKHALDDRHLTAFQAACAYFNRCTGDAAKATLLGMASASVPKAVADRSTSRQITTTQGLCVFTEGSVELATRKAREPYGVVATASKDGACGGAWASPAVIEHAMATLAEGVPDDTMGTSRFLRLLPTKEGAEGTPTTVVLMEAIYGYIISALTPSQVGELRKGNTLAFHRPPHQVTKEQQLTLFRRGDHIVLALSGDFAACHNGPWLASVPLAAAGTPALRLRHTGHPDPLPKDALPQVIGALNYAGDVIRGKVANVWALRSTAQSGASLLQQMHMSDAGARSLDHDGLFNPVLNSTLAHNQAHSLHYTNRGTVVTVSPFGDEGAESSYTVSRGNTVLGTLRYDDDGRLIRVFLPDAMRDDPLPLINALLDVSTYSTPDEEADAEDLYGRAGFDAMAVTAPEATQNLCGMLTNMFFHQGPSDTKEFPRLRFFVEELGRGQRLRIGPLLFVMDPDCTAHVLVESVGWTAILDKGVWSAQTPMQPTRLCEAIEEASVTLQENLDDYTPFKNVALSLWEKGVLGLEQEESAPPPPSPEEQLTLFATRDPVGLGKAERTHTSDIQKIEDENFLKAVEAFATAATTVASTALSTKENPMSESTESPRPTFTEVAKKDAQDAALRLAAVQLLKLTRDPLVATLSRHLGPDDPAMRKKLADFLATEAGTAMLAGILSIGLMAVPTTIQGGTHVANIARELRVKGMTDMGDIVADVLMGPLRQVLSFYLQDPNGIPAMPALPQETTAALPPRSSSTTETLAATAAGVDVG